MKLKLKTTLRGLTVPERNWDTDSLAKIAGVITRPGLTKKRAEFEALIAKASHVVALIERDVDEKRLPTRGKFVHEGLKVTWGRSRSGKFRAQLHYVAPKNRRSP
jgi:hypothetical protein